MKEEFKYKVSSIYHIKDIDLYMIEIITEKWNFNLKHTIKIIISNEIYNLIYKGSENINGKIVVRAKIQNNESSLMEKFEKNKNFSFLIDIF